MPNAMRPYSTKNGGYKRNEIIVRGSLRNSAYKFVASVKQKVSTLENSIGFRHAFSPFDGDSPNTTVVGPDEFSYIDGRRYEFSDGGLMKTPEASPSPWNAPSKYGSQPKIRNGKRGRHLKERLSKQLARCRILQLGSPMVGRRICRGDKRKVRLDDDGLLTESQKENELPKLLTVERVSSSKLSSKYLP